MGHHDDEHDPLDEKAPEGPKRDSRGRFPKGVSGNPAGRKVQFRRDPNLPAAKRRIISAVADELVEVNVGGKKKVMSLFEANVRALAIDGTKNRVAAQRFIELATGNSERDLERRLLTHELREYYDSLEAENERLADEAEPRSGVLDVPIDVPIDQWPPEGLIDDDRRVNMAMVKKLRAKKGKGDSGAED